MKFNAIFLVLLSVLSLASFANETGVDCNKVLTPYSAKYAVFRGDKELGVMTVNLTNKGDQYTYVMDTRATKGLAAFLSLDIHQEAQFSAIGAQLLPGAFRVQQKATFWKKFESVDFDWASLKAKGEKKKKDFEMVVHKGMQDKSTVHLALARYLCEGADDFNIPVVSGPELKDYHYHARSEESMETGIGQVQTVHIQQKTSDGRKQTNSWHAESLNFVPVQIIYRKEKELTTMKLLEIQVSP